jgi:hypothetical protein
VADVDPLEVAAWRMALGELASEDLSEIATDALVRGLDSPALRILAGQPRGDVRESADLFRAALHELGIDLPDPDHALWQLVRRTASGIVAGRIKPADGAYEIWGAYHHVRDSGDLRIFVGLASHLDGHPEDADQIEADIVVAAQELLARPAPRRWIKLMAVRGRSPLTQTASPYDVEVHPETLQLSDALLSDLARWDAVFATALSDWPEGGGFESEQDAERFVAAGRHLVSQLQEELGPSYYVEYMPEPIRPPGVKLRQRPVTHQVKPPCRRSSGA